VEAEGKKCILIAGDVSNQKLRGKAVAGTVRELGALDVLMNNAAFQIHTSQFEDVTVPARAGAPVAVPLEWDGLRSRKSASQFTLKDVMKNLKDRKPPAKPAGQVLYS
jgi:NAD(P)-dependent dehydrogenase (short-subunit alcohol dehydrogenase family)